MLTLSGSQQVDDVTVYRDVSWADGSRALTDTFYASCDSPALVLAPDGRPDFQFYWYRGAPASATAGGLLIVTVTDTPTADRHDALAARIRDAFGLPAGTPVSIAPLPLSAGSVSIAFAGETGAGTGAEGTAAATAGEFTATPIGTAAARATGSDQVSFAVALTRDGAALLAQALGTGQVVLNVSFGTTTPFVLDDIELRSWCDVHASCDIAMDLASSGELTADSLVQALVARHLAGTSTSSQRPLSDAETQALQALTTLLMRNVPTALLASDGKPVPYAPALEQRLNLTLTATYPAELTQVRSANLALADHIPTRVVTVDLTADALIRHVEVAVAGDLTASGIGLVLVHLDYSGTAADGTTVSRNADLTLRPAATTALASFDLATPDQRAVRAHVEVHFADSAPPYAFDLPATEDEVIVLDAGALGVLAVELRLGAVDATQPPSVIVDLAYGTGATSMTAQRILSPAAPAATWLAVVRETPQPWRYRETWVQGTTRLDGDWQTSAERGLVLDAPVGLTPVGTSVSAVSAGDFSDVEAVLLELRDSPSSNVAVLTFTAPNQTSVWTAASRPGALTYQLRQTIQLASGDHFVSAWQDESSPVLIARDNLRFDVTVIGRLLGVGTQTSRAVVEIQGPDSTIPPATVVLDSQAAQPVCTLRLSDPSLHTYSYRLTVVPVGGAAKTSGWATESSSILVLHPPA